MKKACIFIFCIALMPTSYMIAQTYYYRYVESIDGNGVKSKKRADGFYITFTSNSCYKSDKNGYKIGGRDDIYFYKGMENNIHVFECGSINPWGGQYTPQSAFYFSKDYSRMNDVTLNQSVRSFFGENTHIYEISTPPNDTKAPNQLY